jgi:uncharacterized protein with HEPN domain
VSTDKTDRLLGDLARFGRQAERLVALGHEAYMADSFDGERNRAFGEHIVLNIATVAERLPTEFRDAHPTVEWQSLRGMRNLIAHVYDGVDEEFVWRALVHRIPAMVGELTEESRAADG